MYICPGMGFMNHMVTISGFLRNVHTVLHLHSYQHHRRDPFSLHPLQQCEDPLAGVQLQQPGIQPEEMNSVCDETASQFSWTAYLFQV